MATETLNFESPRFLNQLYCSRDENLDKVEKALNIKLVTRDDWVKIEGDEANVNRGIQLFDLLARGRSQGIKFRSVDFDNTLAAVARGEGEQMAEIFSDPLVLKVKNHSIVPKTVNQKRYLQFIQKNDIVFGIGPAGTGKTYLAMAAAIYALMEKQVDKIIVSRPAVEAGEALGFLPGDLTEKIEPYLRPLYDAMYDLLGQEDAMRMMDKGALEIAPLAYMRGRTLSRAYVILDEAQNTTPEQMMMFLTRLGEGSRMIITGDITQVDLPKSKKSGLKQAIEVLNRVNGVKLFYFEHTDVVRHPLVGRIIAAYEQHAREQGESSNR